jgi:predicted lipoprotein with Yx(FWY)xxD motif
MKFLPHHLLGLVLSACTLADEYSADKPEGRAAAYVESDFKSYTRPSAAGNILTTPDGMTVYTYVNEAPGSASCYADCADEWPPVLAPAGAKSFGDLTTVRRLEGKPQWAFRGKPLHFYQEDKAPGDVKGDNKDGLWHVVKP